MNWQPFHYLDKVYELNHLDAFEVIYQQPAQGIKPAQHYSVLVSFGHHCFTRGVREGEVLKMLYPHGPKHEDRLFDLERYELSKKLPDLIKELMRHKCFHTGRDDGTYFIIELLDKDGERIEYEAYFKLFKNSQGQLRLIIESAFRRDLSRISSRPKRKPIRFDIILFNTQQGKKIQTPR